MGPGTVPLSNYRGGPMFESTIKLNESKLRHKKLWHHAPLWWKDGDSFIPTATKTQP